MLVWALISAVVLPVIIILAIPFTFAVLIVKEEKLHFTAIFSWLWGGINLKVENRSGTLLAGPLALKRFSLKKTKAAREKAEIKKIEGVKAALKARPYLSTELISSLFKALQQILVALTIKLEGEASFGFKDPALTGIAYGFIAAGLSGQPALKLTPNFLEAGFEGSLSVKGRFTVGRLLFILFRFLLSRSVRRLWWPWLRRKGVEKNGGIQPCR